jgi:hypothetical protein
VAVLPVRSRTSLSAIAVAATLVAGVIAACAESRFPLGSDCLKDEDCLSGICSQQRCTATPPYLDGEAVATDSAAAADAPELDASAGDSSVEGGAAPEAGSEAAADARTDGPADAPTTSDAAAGGDSADAPTDVRAGG